MLQFLNNQQNRKSHPNENFAREVMELFTLGRGHYSEKDVQEAARAFTGWSFNLAGEFEFRTRIHDFGQKKLYLTVPEILMVTMCYEFYWRNSKRRCLLHENSGVLL